MSQANEVQALMFTWQTVRFYCAARNARRSSYEKGIRLSVCPPKAWIATKR